MIASIKMKGEQLELRLRQRTWGGARPGAGRKPGARPKVRHVARPSHRASHPVHVTVRARAGLPSFREEAIASAVREAIAASGRSPILGRSFRVVQFSVQTNHVHLIVEAHDKESLSRGMRGLNTRLARAVNRVLGVHGRVWGERYHAHALRTPREVRNAIVYSTVLVVLVFIPLFALGGIEGKLFRPLGVAYVVSIVASFLVSLTVTPALCAWLLPSDRSRSALGETRFVRALKRLDRRWLEATLARPWPVFAVAGVLVVAASAAVPLLGREFLPPFNEGTVTVSVLARPGISLTESTRLGALAERLLHQVPEVVSTGRRTGRAEQDEHAEGVHNNEIEVDLRASERSRAQILADMRQQLTSIPGVSVSVGQPISHRLDHLLSGVRAQVAVKISGPEIGRASCRERVCLFV